MSTPPPAVHDSRQCLTLHQPFAWAVIHAGKDVENRSWKTKHRGPLYIHAGKHFDPMAYHMLKEEFPHVQWPAQSEFRHMGLIGYVFLAGCPATRDTSTSPWAIPGFYHWALKNPVAIPFEPCRGAQQIWTAGNQMRVMELPAGFTIKTTFVKANKPDVETDYYVSQLFRDNAEVFHALRSTRAIASAAAMREAHRLHALPKMPTNPENCNCHENTD